VKIALLAIYTNYSIQGNPRCQGLRLEICKKGRIVSDPASLFEN
jgi:hypothetical protein